METTVPKSPDIPEPPAGSVVLDHADFAWQRRANSPDWYRTRGTHAWAWTELTNLRGPLTVVYTPPSDDPSCTGCGRPIHRVHGMWLDDLDAGHCPSGAKQGHNSHTTAAGRFELHATSVMTAVRDGRLVLSLAGPAGSVDVELHPSDLTQLAEDLVERITAGRLADRDVTGWLHGLAGAAAHVEAAEPPALAMYVWQYRGLFPTVDMRGWELLDDTAYPTVDLARARVERRAGALLWDDGLKGRLPGASQPEYRIVELALAGTQGGA